MTLLNPPIDYFKVIQLKDPDSGWVAIAYPLFDFAGVGVTGLEALANLVRAIEERQVWAHALADRAIINSQPGDPFPQMTNEQRRWWKAWQAYESYCTEKGLRDPTPWWELTEDKQATWLAACSQ